MASLKLQARRLSSSVAVCLALGAASSAQAQTRRVDLQVLVVSGGAGDSGSAMVKASLDEGLVPYTEVDLTNVSRASLNEAFLVDTSQSAVRRARFQAVVLPNDAPSGLTEVEKEALARYRTEFKIRQLDSYVYPSAAVGLAPIQGGSLDGATATVTEAGATGPFSYLQGEVPFEDLDPARAETYAYPATPAATEGTTYTPFVEAALPGTTSKGAILGVFKQADGREEMVFTVAVNQYQSATKLLFPGILNWLTYGTHLGLNRLAFSVQVDDVFREHGRWNDALHCTIGESCPAGTTGKRILMTPADVDYLVAWQDRVGMKLDLAFHAGAYLDRFSDAAVNALGRRFITYRSTLRFVNHTYNREPLDCVKDAAGACAKDASGQVYWPAYSVVRAAVARNSDFAAQAGLKFDLTELVTGGHGGLRRPGADSADNPNLIQVLNDLKIGWIASDGSVEREQRVIGTNTRTVPRYPTNIFYNVATKAEEVQEYNWIYSSKAAGGSGSCEANQTCLPPASVQTGFDTVILPREVRTALFHVLANDPRPHYVHQSNLAEDRLLYPLADGVLDSYRSLFKPAVAPLSNPSLRESGTELKNRASFTRGKARVSGYVQGGAVVLSATAASGADATVAVPVTAALSASNASLASYWGVRNGWLEIGNRAVQLPLAADVPYGR